MITTKRKILIICSFLLFSMLFINIYAIESFKPKYGTITGDIVNFRNSPNGNIIDKLNKNEKIKLIGSYNNYYIAQLNNNKIGYISKEYVKILNTNLSIGKIFTRYTPYKAIITNNSVNLRQGPSTSFISIKKLNKDIQITVLGKINDFNIVILGNNIIGAVSSKYISKVNNNTNNNNDIVKDFSNSNDNTNNKVITIINNARKSKNLNLLKENKNLNTIANLKAIEMNDKNYFAHKSPSYGNPFEMMQNFGITYLSAGENIARNLNISTAVNNWIKSKTNSINIFNKNFTDIGVSVIKNKTYGYIIVCMFIEKN